MRHGCDGLMLTHGVALTPVYSLLIVMGGCNGGTNCFAKTAIGILVCDSPDSDISSLQ